MKSFPSSTSSLSSSPDISTVQLLQLRSKEGHVLRVSFNAARISCLVQETYLDEQGHWNTNTTIQDSDPNSSILMDIPRIQFHILHLIIQFMEHYEQEPMIPIRSIPFLQGPSSSSSSSSGTLLEPFVTQDWYRSFIPKDKDTLFSLVAAANFMAIQPLLDLLTLSISFTLMNQPSTEDIRQYLNLPKMTREEEEKAKVEYPWIFTFD